MQTPEREMQRLQKHDVETKAMSAGQYEIARAILVLADQVKRVADSLSSVVHQGYILTKERK